MGKRALFDAARARDDYENGTEGIKILAKRHGISHSTLLRHVKDGGWIRKHAPVRRPRRSKAEMQAIRREEAKRALRENIVGRLFLVIDQKLAEIEKRMQEHAENGTPPSAADMERDARSFNFIMQAYGRVVELDEAARKEWKGRERTATMRSDNADQLRRELALRIERLSRARDA